MDIDILRLLLSYLGTATAFFLIDIIWLGWVGRGIYYHYLSDLLAPQFNWTAAIIFYLVYIVGIYVFAIMPAAREGSLMTAVVMGGAFGFFAYATYEFTNLATLKGWPVGIVPIDIAWGVVLTSSVAAAGYFFVTRLHVLS